MRRLAVLLAACAGVIVGATLPTVFQPVQAQHVERTARPTVDGELIALTSTGSGGRQQVTLIDPRQRVMGVYHIGQNDGEISLKSVRNVRWDLLINEFNAGSPQPNEIRSMLSP